MKLKQKIINHCCKKETIAFLHIGKNAGTAIMELLRKVNEDQSEPYYFTKNGHRVQLSDLPDNQRYLFPVRSPITRFLSGFYSRKRKGRPRHIGDEKWLNTHIREFNFVPEGRVISFKCHCPASGRIFSIAGIELLTPPVLVPPAHTPGASMICFHGDPSSQSSRDTHWGHWREAPFVANN